MLTWKRQSKFRSGAQLQKFIAFVVRLLVLVCLVLKFFELYQLVVFIDLSLIFVILLQRRNRPPYPTECNKNRHHQTSVLNCH